MSAIAEHPGDSGEVVQVLYCLHDGFDLLDVTGPVEVFSHAFHEASNKGKLP